MKLAYSTGNPIVDEVSEMNITGNVIPEAWYRTMCGENGKPKLLAIALLSDILYWYRAREVRDEETGHLLAFQKRFKADMLQRSYRQIEDHFGVSQKQARNALDYLCNIGVVRKHLRNEKTKDGMPIYNNMYLELVPEKLKELTYPQITLDGVPFRELPSAPEGRRVVPKKVPLIQRILQRLLQEITTILSMRKMEGWTSYISTNRSLRIKLNTTISYRRIVA